uniref:Wall-associated receptor kinase galacturonan-binding domain-containing protein n=1 Tax=Aegilops tauschii subsp. strangulata TaxID=200361 RepID=A0A453JT80_AEGTS
MLLMCTKNFFYLLTIIISSTSSGCTLSYDVCNNELAAVDMRHIAGSGLVPPYCSPLLQFYNMNKPFH